MTTNYRSFRDFSSVQEITELSDIHAESTANLNQMKQEERELVAQLITLRKRVEQEDEYLNEVSDFTSKFLKTSTDPEKRSKVRKHYHDRFMKTFHKNEHEQEVKARNIAEKIRSAQKFQLTPGFDPNSWRASLMRDGLEKALIESSTLPASEDRDQLQDSLKRLIQIYLPLTEEQKKANAEKRKVMEANLQQTVAAMTKEFVEKMANPSGEQKSTEENQVVDMPPGSLTPKPAT